MRHLLLIILVFGLCSSPSVAADRARSNDIEIRKAQVGKTLILEFKGNKRAVHRWRLVRDKSPGINLVEVDEIGWMLSADKEASIFQAVDTMRFAVVPKAAGQADLTFEYNYRGWRGKYYLKWKTIRFIIDPAV